MDGFSFENIMSNLFNQIGYESKANSYLVSELLANIPVEVRERWEQSYQKRTNRTMKWNRATSKQVLDHLYKLDDVIQVGPSRFGFQITSNPNERENKVKLARKLWSNMTYTKLDIKTVCVIYLVRGESFEGTSFWTESQREEVIDSVYELVDQLCDLEESEGGVLEFTLFLP